MQRQVYDIDRNAYCLYFHVRSATCFIGSIHLMINLLSIIKYILNYNSEIDFHSNAANSIQFIDQHKTNRLIILHIIAEFLKAFICTLLLYGILKSKASYLVPFFLMQLYYFCRTISYFMEEVSTNHPKNCTSSQNFYVLFKSKSDTLHYNPYNPIWFLASFLYKLYFICVVWKCYRYLKMRELVLPLHYVIQNNVNRTSSDSANLPNVQLPPPDYDTVTKNAPPPDYNTVIKNLPPDYETALRKPIDKETNDKDTTEGQSSNCGIPK